MDITEFEWLEPSRVDAVGNPANGIGFLMLKSVHPEEAVKAFGDGFCGDPACDVCKARFVALDDMSAEKARLKAKDRKALPKGEFAIPEKAPGSGSYPIPDESHARDALARASGKSVEGRVKAAVRRKFPDIKVDGDDDAEKADGGPTASDTTVPEGEAESQTREVGDTEPAGPSPDNDDDGEPSHTETPPAANGDGGGDTAPDKTVPQGEALSQTNDNVEGTAKAGGEADGTGSHPDDKDLHESEGESQTDDNAEGNAEKDAMSGSSDSNPGSPMWEHKDVALGEKAQSLCMELCEVIRTFTDREKAEGGHATKQQERVFQRVRSIVDNPQLLKEIAETMSADELLKALDERETARRAAKKARKQAEAAEVAAKAAQAAEAGDTESEEGAEKGAAELAELRKAHEELTERLEKMEAEDAKRPFVNGAGVSAVLRGADAPAVLKSFEDRVADAEEALKAAGNEFEKARAFTELEAAKKSFFMAKMVNRDNARRDGRMRPGRFGDNSTDLFAGSSLTLPEDRAVKGF